MRRLGRGGRTPLARQSGPTRRGPLRGASAAGSRSPAAHSWRPTPSTSASHSTVTRGGDSTRGFLGSPIRRNGLFALGWGSPGSCTPMTTMSASTRARRSSLRSPVASTRRIEHSSACSSACSSHGWSLTTSQATIGGWALPSSPSLSRDGHGGNLGTGNRGVSDPAKSPACAVAAHKGRGFVCVASKSPSPTCRPAGTREARGRPDVGRDHARAVKTITGRGRSHTPHLGRSRRPPS